ncbi:MAG: CHAP domain-containing protein [Acidimicrobiales bacterium]
MQRGPLGALVGGAGVLLGALLVVLVPPGVAPRAAAGSIPGTTTSWCTRFGSSVVGWTGTKPNLPICGPGPNNGGTWSMVDLPGPYGTERGYFDATEGFQCVELAKRFLAVVDGLAPVFGNGQQVAANYHGAYANTRLYVNGSRGAVGHPPVEGDVISFSDAPGFDSWSPGHVAVVSASSVDRATGDGTVTVSQENVGPGYWRYRLDVVDWRVEDPTTAPNAEWGFPYAEWLQVLPYRVALGAAPVAIVTSSSPSVMSSMPGVVGSFGFGGAHHRVHPGRLRYRPRTATRSCRSRPDRSFSSKSA